MLTFKFARNCSNPFVNKKRTGDFYSHIYLTLWRSKIISWKHAGISYGIRRSNRFQYFWPWNTSNNNQKSICFGIWKLYIELFYKF